MGGSYEHLLWEERDGVVFITVNRPQALNALNARVLEELSAAFTDLRGRSTPAAAVLTGAGEKAFVAGADISELAELGAVSGKDLSLRGQGVLRAVEECGCPVIAAVNGFALGGGCELALACTLRVAVEGAKLGFPEVKLGLIPGYGGTQRLARLVGRGKALEMILTGEPVDAAEALRVGLVNRVVPRERLLPEAEALARAILARGPAAVQLAMQAVYHGNDLPLGEGQLLEATLFGIACGTEDMKEGTRAFLEKRAAKFTGR